MAEDVPGGGHEGCFIDRGRCSKEVSVEGSPQPSETCVVLGFGVEFRVSELCVFFTTSPKPEPEETCKPLHGPISKS